jgi:hypothetical protein
MGARRFLSRLEMMISGAMGKGERDRFDDDEFSRWTRRTRPFDFSFDETCGSITLDRLVVFVQCFVSM